MYLWVIITNSFGKLIELEQTFIFVCRRMVCLNQNLVKKLKLLSRLMKNVTLDKPTPVQFSENGVSQIVNLRIVNIQHLTEKYTTRQIWKEVRIEFYLNETTAQSK